MTPPTTHPSTNPPIRWEFWPSVITLPVLVLVIVLGVWQLERLEWKQSILRKIEQNLHEAAQPLPAEIADPDALEYSFVSAEGTYLHDKELLLGAQYYSGILGYKLLTPLQLTDGRMVLVNRGWVPKEQREQDTRAETLAEGVQTVEGIVRMPNRRNIFTPENDPTGSGWFWIDQSAIEGVTGVSLMPIVLERVSEGGEGLPIPAKKAIELRNDHFMYAITWFAMAIIVVVIYFTYHLSKRKKVSE